MPVLSAISIVKIFDYLSSDFIRRLRVVKADPMPVQYLRQS